MNRFLLILLVCILYAATTHLQAQDTPAPIVFIYDASGSMWGQMEGKTKMQIAGKVLSETLDQLPDQQPLGLVAYGHRRKKDCEDVETLVKMENADKQAVRESIAGIKPLGRTPLAYSAQQVIDELQKTQKKATIILITDGIESCNGDLCEVVKKAKAAGIAFKLHIIGFGLKNEETENLHCAAKAGDGEYYDAADAGSLEVGLNEATTATIDPVKVDPPIPVVKNFSAYVTKNGEPVDAIVKAYPKGESVYKKSLRTYADTGKMSLPAGTYNLEFQPLEGSDVSSVFLSDVEIYVDSLIHRTMSFDAGNIALTVTRNGEGQDASMYIYPAGTRKSVGQGRTYGRTKSKEVNPGKYDVTLKAIGIAGVQTEHQFTDVEVQPGETTELSHDFSTGTLSYTTTTNGEGWDATTNILPKGDNKKVAGKRTYGKTVSEELTTGEYTIRFKPLNILGNKEGYEETVTVKANETTEVQHDFKKGTITLEVKSGGTLVDATVNFRSVEQQKNFQGRRSYTTPKTNPRTYDIQPGKYVITVKALGDFKGQKKEITIEVKAGETKDYTIEF